MLTIVGKLADRLAYVIECQMRVLFFESHTAFDIPALDQLLDRTDVDIAVVKVGFQLWHMAHHKATVLADAIAAHR